MAAAATTNVTDTNDSLMYMINHVVLPPKLPGTSDTEQFANTDRVLLQSLLAALPGISSTESSSTKQDSSLQTILHRMIEQMILLTDENGRLLQKPLLKAFAELPTQGGIIPIYIQAQKAALIVRKEGDRIIFEAFELAPSNHAVMSTKGRLKRCFPGPAIGVPVTAFNEPGFQTTVAETLAKMSFQDATEMKATAKKAGQSHIEIRDTNSPELITDFLMSFLESVGQPVSVQRIWKNTREEVLWSNTLLPWRRSPVWLLTRVALQTTSHRLSGSGTVYKQLIVIFLTDLLAATLVNGTPCEILHCLISKISKRLSKLGEDVSLTWLQQIQGTLDRATRAIQAAWDTVIASEPDLPTEDLQALEFAKDSVLQMEGLDDYTQFVRESASSEMLRHTFSPPKLTTKFPTDILPVIPTSGEEVSIYVLAAFEHWVPSHLADWLNTNISDPAMCARLLRPLRQYHDAASGEYKGNPESISIMLLTCLELWVACDKSAIHQHPLLLDYSPGIPSTLLRSLLLPLKAQLQRLSRLEDYLAEREGRAKSGYPSPLSKFGVRNSFAVRHYASSKALQDLRVSIEEWASDKREIKLKELAQKKAEYARLINLHDSLKCEYRDVYDSSYNFTKKNVHVESSCNRCVQREKAKNMKINLDEWPLPQGDMQAQATVFELDCPMSFNAWRDATLFLIMGVLQSKYTDARDSAHDYGPSYCLSKFVRTSPQRLRLVSTSKPHVVTHRRSMLVSDASVVNICVNNGLIYQYYDKTRNCFASDVTTTEDIPKMCTYSLRDYKSLQGFICRPPSRPHGPMPNHVIAEQHSCPSEMSLEKFKSLGTLPLGVRLQWSNILVQMSLPSVDFKQMDTTLVILQVIHQAGPNSVNGIARDGHVDLEDEIFGRQLGRALFAGLERIKENWESRHALESFIAISTRLLSLCGSEEVSESCRRYLRLCRQVALGWTWKVRTMAREAATQAEKDELLRRTFENALVCTSTFEVDEWHLRSELSLPSEAAILIECSVRIHETSHAALDRSDPILRISTQRWSHLSCRALPHLLAEMKAGNPYLDLAIGNCWSGYRAECAWQSETKPSRHWVTTTTAQYTGAASQIVQYNLLSGELRVDGLPLSRLPSTFEGHAMYKVLFDRSTIEVMRTTMTGKEFSAMNLFRGYETHFALQRFEGGRNPALAGQDLMLTCMDGQQRYDLLPPRIFRDNLPDHFVDDYVHWYDYDSHTVDLRPKQDPWRTSADHWKLSLGCDGWVMTKGNDAFLTSMASPTGKDMSTLLSSIESPKHVHLIFHPSQWQLVVELPRLKLDFVLTKGSSRLSSRQFRGMYLDSNQHIGTLVGLKSKTVLRNDKGDRLALVPDGKVDWKGTKRHIEVVIKHGSSTKVYPFELDTLLGRIMDNGTLESKLSLCYLHALTAFCLPDQLTGKTGTERALEILNSASVRSFDKFSEENITALHAIANLAPCREYYPPKMRVMQNIQWVRGLRPLSQHGQFYKAVARLLSQTESLAFFHPGEALKRKDLDRGSGFLLERDLIRSSVFRSSGFGAEDHTAKHDNVYDSRLSRAQGKGERSSRYESAFRAASRVYHGLQSRQSQIPRNLAEHLWKLLLSLPANLVAYDAERLHDWRAFVGLRWCQIHRALSDGQHNKFRIMMFLATLAYAHTVDSEAIEVLVAMSKVPHLRKITIPVAVKFDLRIGRHVVPQQLRTALQAHLKPFHKCPEYTSAPLPSETHNEMWDRRTQDYRRRTECLIYRLVNDFVDRQWPCEVLQRPSISDIDTYININSVLSQVKESVGLHWDCHRFYEYLRVIEKGVQQQQIHSLPGSMLTSILVPSPGVDSGRAWLSENELFAQQAPCQTKQAPKLPELSRSVEGDVAVTQRLLGMISRLEGQANLRHEKDYVQGLQESCTGLHAQSSRNVYTSLVDGLSYTTRMSVGGTAAKHNSPRVTPTFFLKQLARKRWARLPQSWKDAVVAYGVAITTLQRAWRLRDHNKSDLIKELLNPGHENWSPHDDPESLLIEIESGIFVRKVQAEIAQQMKHPVDDENAVMQLNMGEGKSSVIVPITAAALANGSRLVRVVVAKPQSKQMFQMLVSKLGGLCDRQVYHMPFSRSLVLGPTEVNTIAETYRKCMETGGILLVQPAHILSFQLMGVETNLSGQADKQKVSESLLRTQHFFNMHSRDIVDESDENFSVKFELVYTMGTQRPIDFSPGRWHLIQTILFMIRKVIPDIQKQLPSSIELEQGPAGSFPRARLLRHDAQELLCQRLAKEICESGVPDCPIARQSTALREAVLAYITKPDLTVDEVSAVEGRPSFWTDAIKQPLLLLRGLIAGGVLAFAFSQKRWRVNYGLTPTRRPETRLAVPYRAKDSPAARSEFSHPDVVIVLTCLSYYCGGLKDKDLFTAFEHVIKSDQADNEYEEWVRDAPTLPVSFRNLVGINLKDRYQCIRDVFPHLRQSQAVIDFFLARIVFPKHMKDGTNDSKHLLPLTVRHLDLEEQRHTNALVLLHLLQPENKVETMPPSSDSECSDAVRLLRLVVGLEDEAQVILDVGAQVIELSNIEVAAEWLKMTASTPAKQAVVFFDDADNIMVRDRAGHVEAFQTSPYAKQLDLCYVFLDEAHTRGTDLKLPQDYRAVATLGAGLTKDRLVQACMRMRKLGKGQSVVFCVPEEIRMKILGVTGKPENSDIEVSDVLMWSIHETYSDLRKCMPLWAAQGMRYERQSLIWAKSIGTDGITLSTEKAEKFLEQEALSLEERYKPRDDNTEAEELFKDSANMPRAAEIRERCQLFDSIKPNLTRSTGDVRTFITTGKIVSVHPAFKPAFKALSKISAAARYDVSQFPTDLLVTADFARTVKLVGKKSQSDAYQRSVQWVVTTRAPKEHVRMVIISPVEAQGLMADIKASNAVFLHLYAPRSNLAFQPLDDLKLYTVPTLPDGWSAPTGLVLQLNLFAGQLYFRSYEEYKRACEFLGLAWRLMDGNTVIEPDGFIVPGTSDADCRFRKSPTKFLQVLMATIRRDGRAIGKTHWGRLLAGEILKPDEFEDPDRMDESW
ncbi:hypothetical protein GE09DRAFT_1173514 [Coniochaeta sp. 2T2.1]|nr:hypothetical protein GE09DRAFT_1173514 [Coniochaeta sp. 2T2.1]